MPKRYEADEFFSRLFVDQDGNPTLHPAHRFMLFAAHEKDFHDPSTGRSRRLPFLPRFFSTSIARNTLPDPIYKAAKDAHDKLHDHDL